MTTTEAAPLGPGPEAQPSGHPFKMLLALIGTSTSDGRVFDQLTWRDLPLSVLWQPENLPGHEGAVVVGRLDRIVRDGQEVWGYGVLDTVGENGQEVIRLIGGKFLKGVSVDAAVLEVSEADDGTMHFSAEIGAVTIVAFAAFRETQIELEDGMPAEAQQAAAGLLRGGVIPKDRALQIGGVDLPEAFVPLRDEAVEALYGEDVLAQATGNFETIEGRALAWCDVEWETAAVSGSTSLPLADRGRAWDGTAAEKRVRSWAGATDAPNARYASAFFIIDGPRDQFGSYHLGFADVIGGRLMAVPRGIIACAGAVQGSRGAKNPAFQAAKGRIAAYYRKMKMTPPWQSGNSSVVSQFEGVGLLASAAHVQGPPSDWFHRHDCTKREPLHVEADGRVWGHIYTWGQCHTGSPKGQCVQAEPSRTNYAYFLTGHVLTAEGDEIPTGPICLSADHAALSASWLVAKDHYANSALACADVACGEDEFGIWVAGCVRPGATEEQIHALRASAPSGDWRPIGSGLELVAILSVNTPGFPALAASFSDGHLTGLVASGAPVESSCGCGGGTIAETLQRQLQVLAGPVLAAWDDEIDGLRSEQAARLEREVLG